MMRGRGAAYRVIRPWARPAATLLPRGVTLLVSHWPPWNQLLTAQAATDAAAHCQPEEMKCTIAPSDQRKTFR